MVPSPLHITSVCLLYQCAHTCTWECTYTYMYMNIQGWHWVSSLIILHLFFFETRCLTTDSETQAAPTLQCWDYKGLPPHLAFCVGFWGLNSGPFAFMVDTLLTEPSPQPLLYNPLYDTAQLVFPHEEAGVVILTSWITLKMKWGNEHTLHVVWQITGDLISIAWCAFPSSQVDPIHAVYTFLHSGWSGSSICPIIYQ